MATPHFGGLLVAFIALVNFHLVTAQEFCASNQCSNGETCYNRPGSAVSSYACLCTGLQVGYDCSQNVYARVLNTCYGTQCQSGSYSSPNYPGTYPFRDKRVFLLFIPGATEITFVFSDPFQVEPRKDGLHIGAGLTYDDKLDLNWENVSSKQIYFYEGSIVPQDLTLFNTDSAFITWKTDKNIELQGFEVTWTTNFDGVLPVATCPADIQREVGLGQTRSQVCFTAPTATDNSGVVPTIVSQTHAPNDVFALGITKVIYTFADGSGNQASCSFNIIVVQADPVPPLITGCPGDIKSSISLEARDIAVFWTPPVASDNSGLLPDIISNFSPGNRFAPGVWNVIYTSTDGAGNTQQCQFSITITRKVVSIIVVGILLAFVALYGLIITLMYLHLRRSNIALKQSVSDREGQELDPYTPLDTTTMNQPSYEEIKATRDRKRDHTNEIEGLEYENQTKVELEQTARVNNSNLGVANENTEPEYELPS